MEILKERYYSNHIFKDEINISILFDNILDDPIINSISFKDLQQGKYQDQNSKSDIIISKSIKFFTNNLPSFKIFSSSSLKSNPYFAKPCSNGFIY